MPSRSYWTDKVAEHQSRIEHLEQMLLVLTQPKPEVARLLMPPMEVHERQEEPVRRLQNAIHEV